MLFCCWIFEVGFLQGLAGLVGMVRFGGLVWLGASLTSVKRPGCQNIKHKMVNNRKSLGDKTCRRFVLKLNLNDLHAYRAWLSIKEATIANKKCITNQLHGRKWGTKKNEQIQQLSLCFDLFWVIASFTNYYMVRGLLKKPRGEKKKKNIRERPQIVSCLNPSWERPHQPPQHLPVSWGLSSNSWFLGFSLRATWSPFGSLQIFFHSPNWEVKK